MFTNSSDAAVCAFVKSTKLFVDVSDSNKFQPNAIDAPLSTSGPSLCERLAVHSHRPRLAGAIARALCWQCI